MAYIQKFEGKKNSEMAIQGRKLRDKNMVLLAMQGLSIPTIAARCDVSVSTVVKRLPELLDKETDKMDGLIKREVTLQLGILSSMLEKCVEQFDKSCQMGVEVVRKDEGEPVTGGNTEGDKAANSMKVKSPKRTVISTHVQNTGDPRFLTEARAILGERRKLLGLDQDEIKRIIINTFVKEVTINNNVQNSIELSQQEALEMSEIYKNLGMSIDGLPLSLPAPAIEGEFQEEDDASENDRNNDNREDATATVAPE